jgi:hypothetical protein
MVAVVVVVGMPATMKMASVTVEAMVVLILGKVGRR